MRNRCVLLVLWLTMSLGLIANDSIPARVYYTPRNGHYTGEDFFNALDIPTVFGLGINPTGVQKGVGYYAQMYLEWRQRKTYGWLAMVGMDTHNQNYDGLDMSRFDTKVMNVTRGTVYNTEIYIGPGYRIPLVKDIRGYYAHPYQNRWNLNLGAQFGCDWAVLKYVEPDPASTPEKPLFRASDADYICPVMKVHASVEWFLSPMFALFLNGSYIQHLQVMPWDNPTTKAGTLVFAIGLTGFFD